MKCPNCGKKVNKQMTCENCKVLFIDDNDENNRLLIVAMIVLLIIILFIILYLFFKDNKIKKDVITTTTIYNLKTTGNIGTKLDMFQQAKIGETVISSYIYNDKYYDVDVKGIKFFDGEEINKFGYTPREGFKAYGFEYEVKFNELANATNLNPILKSEFKKYNGNNFVEYNDERIKIETTNYYTGQNVMNGESAHVYVLYSIPEDTREYSICLGYVDKNYACFSM